MARSVNMPITRVEAVDGQSIDQMKGHKTEWCNALRRHLTLSEIACFKSHREAWKMICENEGEFGVIFEDDIYLSTSITGFLKASTLREIDMDIIKIDKATRKKVKLGPRVRVVNGISVSPLLSQHMGCGGYILSKRCAARLLENTRSIKVPVDYVLFGSKDYSLPNLKVMQANPALCIHSQFSKYNFLPPEAERSVLDLERFESIKSQKKHVNVKISFAKICKEISRPIKRFVLNIKRTSSSLVSEEKWQKIGFVK